MTASSVHKSRGQFLVDLMIYLPIMFLIREIYFKELSFIINGLMWSLIMFGIASWRIKARGLSWADLGLLRPKSIRRSLVISAVILASVVISMIFFEIIKDQLPAHFAEDSSSNDNRFSYLKENYLMLAAILPLVWLESMLEELLDRGFLITWIENLFNKSWATTIIAVLLQAAIFGFRHSYDISMRSLSVALIGLVFGIAYVVSGRNLWPLIIAHCALNTISMFDRV